MDPWLFLPFCPDDLEAVVAIESQSFAQPWKRRALEGELGSPGALAFVLKPPGVAAQSDVAAYIFLRLLINEVHIMKLAVAPEHRRQGLATYLVGRALAEARPGDGVLVAGKGHETYQILGTTTIDFDDREEARKVLNKLNSN